MSVPRLWSAVIDLAGLKPSADLSGGTICYVTRCVQSHVFFQ